MATPRGRLVYTNQAILDQADFFQSDGFTRVTGISTAQITSQLFLDNVLLFWPLTSGVGITDAQIVAGYIYWNEVTGAPGFYSVRFRPHAVGYWRCLINYAAGEQISAQDYDVVSQPPNVDQGLKTAFIRPG